METTITLDDVAMSSGELASCEAASAQHAARLASECLDEVQGLADDQELARAWSEQARGLASIALAHSHRAAQYAPMSRAAVEAREAAEKAKGFARAAIGAAVRD
jgi:hypothetical protein